MGRRPNYGFQKHQTDLKKQKKREEKEEKKRLKSEAVDGGDSLEPEAATEDQTS